MKKAMILIILLSSSYAFSAPTSVIGTKANLVKALLSEYDACTHVDSFSSEILGNVVQYVCKVDEGNTFSFVDLQYYNNNGSSWLLSK